MKKIMLLIILIMILPMVFANGTDIATVGQSFTITSNHVLAQSGYYNNVTAYITIAYPNGTQAVLSQNTTPSLVQNGVFLYNYTPTIAGIYFTSTQFYNATDDIGIGSSTFVAQEPSDMLLAIILGLVAVMAFFFIIGFNLISKPISNPQEATLKLQDLGMFFILLDFIFVIIILGLLQNFAIGQTYSGIMDTVYGIGIWVTTLVMFLYVIAYTVYRIAVRLAALKGANKTYQR